MGEEKKKKERKKRGNCGKNKIGNDNWYPMKVW